MVKVFGELAGGKAGEVDVHAARKEMGARGALSVYVNRNGLKSREEVQVKVAGEDAAAIERNLFSANVARLRLSTKELTGASGAEHALELLRLTRQGQKSNEMKKDYSKRVVEAAAQAILARDVLEERVE
ncbi:MAG: hypothetical protein JRN23_00480 [Nitrososphaerota archaeon]|nr:hypothetical protein [Nitrososphaerota archaeon]